MKAFGPTPHPRLPNADTPVGESCRHCEEPIAAGDQGFIEPFMDETGARWVPLHEACFLRQIFGSVGHQLKTCSCFGGGEEDPKGLTKRQAAQAAVDLFLRTHRQVKVNRS